MTRPRAICVRQREQAHNPLVERVAQPREERTEEERNQERPRHRKKQNRHRQDENQDEGCAKIGPA